MSSTLQHSLLLSTCSTKVKAQLCEHEGLAYNDFKLSDEENIENDALVAKFEELEQDSDRQVNDDASTWLLHTSHSEHEPMSLFKAQELTEDCKLS